MFDDLTRLANNLKRFDVNLVLFQLLSKPELQDLIRTLNLREQLFEGIDSLGVELDVYSAGTETILEQDGENAFAFEGKRKKKLAGQPIFLFDSGEFYDSFELKVSKDSIIFDADPVKDDGTDLFTEYGEDILGLTEENFEILIEKLSEKIVPAIFEKLTS